MAGYDGNGDNEVHTIDNRVDLDMLVFRKEVDAIPTTRKLLESQSNS